ncbi:1237_t:CDS:2, partial [Acaulospora colombiana]
MKRTIRISRRGVVANRPQYQTTHSEDDVSRFLYTPPIHHLPPEILSMIFSLTVDQLDWASRTLLGSICRRWREVAINTKSLWNKIPIAEVKDTDCFFRTNGMYPCSEFLQIILERASGSPITVDIDASTKFYECILAALHGVMLDISSLLLSFERDDEEYFPGLDWDIRHLRLPSLRSLNIDCRRIYLSQTVDPFFKRLLDIAVQSRMVEQLDLILNCDTSLLVPPHEIFSKARCLKLYLTREYLESCEQSALGLTMNMNLETSEDCLRSLQHPISLSAFQHLHIKPLGLFLKCITSPRLYSIETYYYKRDENSQLAMLKSVASQLREMTLGLLEYSPVLSGCPVPFPQLRELCVKSDFSADLASLLILASNLEYLL